MEVTWDGQLEEEAGSWVVMGKIEAHIGDPWDHKEDMGPGAWDLGSMLFEGARTCTGRHNDKQGSICTVLVSQSLEEEDSQGRSENFRQRTAEAAREDSIQRIH